MKIYGITKSFPKEEDYGLKSQMRRASVSIIANVVEGHGKRYLGEFIKFVSTAISSCNELGVCLLLSKDLNYINKWNYDKIKSTHEEVSKMLFGLRKALERIKYEKKNTARV